MFPPTSLIIAIMLMAMLAVGIGIATALFLTRRSIRWANGVAIAGAAMLVLHATLLNGNPVLAVLVRSSDAIVWSNLSPLFVAALAAAGWRSLAIRWQRRMIVVLLPLICFTQAYGPLFGRVPETSAPRVVNGVHHQSTLSTCSAAAAATLLGTIGVTTNEAEMADLCLTREAGTLQLGLYRGLRIKAPHTTFVFLNYNPAAVLASDTPVIVSLGAPAGAWSLLRPRGGHSVVILGRNADDALEIADPMTGGRYPMEQAEFRRIWTGEAIRIGR